MASRGEVGDIVAMLLNASSNGVAVVGPRGAGKTWVLGQVLAALGPDAATIRLSPSAALSTIPFGAVNARIGMDIVRSSDHYEVLNGLLAQVRQGFETAANVFIVVDNGEHLDEQSAAVITQVIMSTDAKLILVDQSLSPRSHLRQLVRDGHLSRFELKALDHADVRTLLEDVLGGTVALSTVEYLASRSSGNPLVLKGLAAGALEEGSLHNVNGLWVLDHPSDRMGSESHAVLQMLLEDLPAESRRIVEILALADALPLDVLLDITDSDSIDDIQQRGMVTIEQGPSLTMKLARPATAGAIRKMVPIGRSRRLWTEVSGVFDPCRDGSPDMLISFTRWAVDCGVPVEDARVLAMAQLANQLLRVPEALQFSTIAVGSQLAGPLAASAAVAHLTANMPERARSLALKSLKLAQTPDDGAAALKAVHVTFFATQDYRARLDAALAGYQERFGPVTLAGASTRAEIDVLTVMAEGAASVGDTVAARDLLTGLLAHPLAGSRADQAVLKSMMCEILCATGKSAPAAALAVEVMAEIRDPEGFPRPDQSILAYSRAVCALIHDGRWALVRKALAPEVFINPNLLLAAGGLRHLGAAMVDIRRGHFEEALSHLVPAVGTLMAYDHWSVLSTALGMLAYCQIMHGDHDGAQLPLGLLDDATHRGSKFMELEGQAYAAAARVMAGDRERGIRQLRKLMAECTDKGLDGPGLVVLSLLLRVGESDAVAPLAALAGRVDMLAKDFYLAWAAALHSQDALELERAGEMAAGFGLDLLAVELAIAAQRKFHDGGKVHKSRKAASKVVMMREQLPGLVAPVFNAAERPQMTRREHEIAMLVARGDSNSTIAAKLNVSQRTVEGHLYRTFIKLDIQSREQLTMIVNNLAVPGAKKVLSL